MRHTLFNGLSVGGLIAAVAMAMAAPGAALAQFDPTVLRGAGGLPPHRSVGGRARKRWKASRRAGR